MNIADPFPQLVRLVAVSGSLRRESANTALLQAAITLAPAGVSIELFNLIDRLPHFNPDIESEGWPMVTAWREALENCDGIIIASPEYAHGVPGALKNALDWVVSSKKLSGKPVAFINTSARAVHAQAALAEILATMGLVVIEAASPTIHVAGLRLQPSHIAADPALAAPLRAAIDALHLSTKAPA